MPLDPITRTIDRAFSAAGLDPQARMPAAVLRTIEQALQSAGLQHPPAAHPPAAEAGAAETRFQALAHSGPHGQRAYRLYVPAAPGRDAPRPLLVMLHGCRQDAADFARGTRMNALAEQHGFLVAYPEQSRAANGSNCWRWYERPQQQRDSGEPALIAGIVADIARAHRIDGRRVFVAGLSAGASMAVILGQAYPELFAGVAAHSGLPCGAAHDVASAFTAMREGPGRFADAPRRPAVPTLVFHGDADATVAAANGTAIVRQAVADLTAERGPLRCEQRALDANGHACIRTCHHDRDGLVVAEHWAVQGGGHAWFGGDPAGSFASAQGPDASRETVRFFGLHAR